jgi:mannosyltransferase OCH1-like enzyme
MKKFIDLLIPKKTNNNLIRVGPNGDGGYVIPEICIQSSSSLFTYGVGYEVNFENQYVNEYERPVYMFDHTIPIIDYGNSLINFYSEGLGIGDNCDDFLNHYKKLNIQEKIFLKIDVEGAEYSFFENTNIKEISSIVTGFCIEVHNLDKKDIRERFTQIFNQIEKYFTLVHIHANNFGDVFELDGFNLNSVFELTYINKNFVLHEEDSQIEYPIQNLDYPNTESYYDFDYGFIKKYFMKKEGVKIDKYTSSTIREEINDVIYIGRNDENVLLYKLKKTYKNPKFVARKFNKWHDTFSIDLIEDNYLRIKRTDANLGWGAALIIDVEHEADDNLKNVTYQSQNIPRIIHQTFKTNIVPYGMYESIESWKNKNGEYEHFFYTDDDCINFIQEHFDKNVLYAYLNLIPGAFKADLFRCCVLYIKGGVYVDSDMICLSPLKDLIEDVDSFIITRDDPMSKSFLYNAFIASEPKHPFLKKQIDSIVDNVFNLKDLYYLEVSGPCLFGKTVNAICGRNIQTEYDLGNQIIGDFKIKILEHDFKSRTIKNNNISIIFTEYSEKNDEMKELQIPTYYSLFKEGKVYQQIPRNIISTSEDTLGMNTYMVDSFTEKNKYWDFKHYVGSDRINFLKQNKDEFFNLLGFDVLEFYHSLEKGVEKADFFRYCAIYLMGGLYSDADTFCNIELDQWIGTHDLILGAEMYAEPQHVSMFGGDKIGQIVDGMVLCVCNYTFAAKPKHEFLKGILLDIYNNPIKGDILLNTATGRMTKHAYQYFKGSDFSQIKTKDLEKGSSILLSINRVGSNQGHSGSYKNTIDPMDVKIDGVYIVHMFEGTWWNVKNKTINVFKSKFGTSHNLTVVKDGNEYIGVGRLDKDTSRTRFMEKIGDCRSLVEYKLDSSFNLIEEFEKPITNYDKIAKFEDYRFFTFNGKNYLSVSYVDDNFNTRVAILNDQYSFMGDIKIDNYNEVTWLGKTRVWEKNWLFVEKDGVLFLIYSTTPNYIVYKCDDFDSLSFVKHIDIPWPLKNNVPEKDHYFTSHIGSSIRIATGGSTNPLFLKDKNIYLYFIHTKIYDERRYNHYAVILDSNLTPIKFVKEPIIKKFVPHGLLFVSSVVETYGYLVFTGGVEDNSNFTWELSKGHLFKMMGI